MRNCLLTLILLTTLSTSYSQTKKIWFPDGLNIQPFTANFLEPRAGFSYLTGLDNIRLDIGTSSDIYKIIINNKTISFGADLFTYTRLEATKEFRFPVKTIDYLFGFNAGYKKSKGDKTYGFRLRLSHISAHLVDGSYNSQNPSWSVINSPITYSREFFELFPFYKYCNFRVYTGFTYLLHIIPKNFGRWIFQAGFDYYSDSFIAENISPFIAYDFKLSKINAYSGNNIICVGIKFGKYDGKGVSLLYSYLSGKSIHGEYYNLNEDYSTIGINFDL